MSVAIRRGETLPPKLFGPFDADAVRAYADASADDNPLHVDPTLAAKAGLAKPPIHGMLIMGCFEVFLRGWRPDATVKKLSSKFIKPVLVGERIELTGKIVQAAPAEPAVLRLMVKSGRGELVCLAEAFVTA